MNRPRASLPAALPPELLAAIGLLCLAGLALGIPTLQTVPDALDILSEQGVWESAGPLALAFVVALGVVAGACFLLAARLTRGNVVARLVAIVVAGSLALGLLVGDGLDDFAGTVALISSLAAVACLAAPRRIREFFATGRLADGAPAPVVAAEMLMVVLAAVLLLVGVGYLPLRTVKAQFAVAGLVMIGVSVACIRNRTRLGTGDPGVRTLVSALMAGYVVAVLLGNEDGLTGPLFIALGVAVSTVVLLWVPPESQAFFLGGGVSIAGLSGSRNRRRAPPPADAPPPPPSRSPSPFELSPLDEPPPFGQPPFGRAPFERTPFEQSPFELAPFELAPIERSPSSGGPAGYGPSQFEPSRLAPSPFEPSEQEPTPFEVARPTRFDPPPPPPRSSTFDPPPAPPLPPRTSTFDPPPPPPSAPPPGFDPPPVPATVPPRSPSPPSALPPLPPAAGGGPAPGSAAPRVPATPPDWLLEPPPAGFWPVERRRPDPRRYEVVDVAPLTDELQSAPGLGIRFDTTSWFPVLENREQVRGAYLVSMVMFEDAPAPDATAFRGTSTLLVTSARLVGVCARGESEAGPLGPGPGRVVAWRVLLDQVDWVRAEGSADGGHLILKGYDADRPWALLTKPRVAAEGAFQPARLADLADLVNRAKHSTG